MSFLTFDELRRKTDKDLEKLYHENCGSVVGSPAEAEQSSNRYKIELILRERADQKNRIVAWVAIAVAILIATTK